ncbi:hypothetical protein PIB30_064018 [Stylosanthes scabra]|uniref:Receptor-like serine/threonine-protein kinase n=1 Tax=Stylosanthes scabra TaxID=79078 RepID=A0ABU6RLW9_9FABA|nr:hypothetical protein [Stylosanthes scabra]
MESFKVLVVCTLLIPFYFIPICNTLNSIDQGQSLKENETLVSEDGAFEAGFFNFGDSNRQYFGIWYNGISPRTIVWVANRDTPIENSSGVLNVTDGGNLVILDGTGASIWSSNSTSRTAKKPFLQLLDTANLVVKDGSNSPQNLILWQSFDIPGDTFLPGMKVRANMASGNYTSLICWRDTQDPAIGLYAYHIDPHGYPQVVITKGGTLIYRVGSWNGNMLSGVPSESLYKSFNLSFEFNDQEVSYSYGPFNKSIVSRYMVTTSGQIQRFILDQTKTWQLFMAGPVDQCDNYAFCGSNSNCDVSNSPECDCLQGFAPKSQEKWSAQNWSGGCVRKVNLSCDSRDGFLKFSGMKIPDTSKSWYNRSMNLEDCKNFCLKNCSCTACANLDVRHGGSGCLLWFNDIVDVRKQTSEGQDLYIKVAASELDNNKGLNKKQLAGILVGCSLFIIVMVILGIVIHRKNKLKKSDMNQQISWKNHSIDREREDIDIPIYDLSTIAIATSHFSISKKLGEGGFGPVYKGTLTNGQEIAVKRLSHSSGQGPNEFINEVKLIANLQHRNLVKLLGCCIHGDERLLIYEFMPNRSLDCFIFDQAKRSLLHWDQRFQIIRGIARGLLYLHQDSRLRIIHRDLKTSNILLDQNMNSKISDFGLARTFGGDQLEGITKRIVGTHGYISPEYAARGNFSVKSDVFSFGVIVLETISGHKNREFFDDNDLDLLGHAWRLWCEERPLELIDESVADSVSVGEPEVLRCINIGLLCVQERPEDRPDMSAIVLMLNGEKPLARPREPAFYPHQFGSSSGNCAVNSANEISITLLDAR